MTIEQLNALPLFSKVRFTDKTAVTGTEVTVEAVVIKIRNNEARLYDATNGWLSYYKPADRLTLVESFNPGSLPAPTNFLTMPLYSIVSYKGAECFLIGKEIVQNEFVPDGSADIENATIWFYADEILLTAIPAREITFVELPSIVGPGVNPDIIPTPTPDVIPTPTPKTGMSTKSLLIIGGIGLAIYFLAGKTKNE